ncbi:hypothetical protein SAMN05660748_3916 [Blastococcus aggregatus]|uniref:Uncharacterized protein n=1 Tax=Blastococcus aggregatus TaxID=38502 RepID=A0A285VD52_9ACTN|nr:hypothetical protein [Blastococcus aggregatus]SOC51990.1 hypothetical protein SAMN05660748_3916 [Blastococcus aggregatus]
MTSITRARTALLAAVLVASLAGCADTADGEAVAPGSVAGVGTPRPWAGGEELVVDPLPPATPVVLDPVPDGLLVTNASDDLTSGSGGGCATLYGDPALTDTLDGPVLLVGSSSGSAHGGPTPGGAGAREVDLGGGRTGTVIPDLVAGCPADGPGGLGSGMVLQGPTVSWATVSVVRADPRLAALWGFWLTDPTGTSVRGLPGSAGALTGAGGGDVAARGRVWAEDGLVLSAVMYGGGDDLLDEVVRNLRVGTVAEADALEEEIRNRPPTGVESPCPSDSGFVSGVEGASRWVFHLAPNPHSGWGEWSACQFDLTSGSGSGGSVMPPPLGELAVQGWGSGIVGGVAPPGTARVTVTAADGSTLEAVLAADGPRPGERVWGTFIPLFPPPGGIAPFTVTAYDAAGAVLASQSR